MQRSWESKARRPKRETGTKAGAQSGKQGLNQAVEPEKEEVTSLAFSMIHQQNTVTNTLKLNK
jgi:hypothetical protein